MREIARGSSEEARSATMPAELHVYGLPRTKLVKVDSALSVEAIALDVEAYGPQEARVVVSGGGVRNRALLAGIAFRLGPRFDVMPSDDFGIDADAKEAIAFAVLGYETLRGRPAGLPGATGAERATLLGAIVPHKLGELLRKVERETKESKSAK